MVRLPLVLQRPTQAPQLFQRRPHGGVQGQHLRGSKNLLPGPCQSPQAAECVRPLAGEARGLSGFAQHRTDTRVGILDEGTRIAVEVDRLAGIEQHRLSGIDL